MKSRPLEAAVFAQSAVSSSLQAVRGCCAPLLVSGSGSSPVTEVCPFCDKDRE